MKRRDWGTALLAAGAALGAAIAAIGIVGGGALPRETVPDNAVAVVNDVPILQSDYQRALRAMATDLRDGRVSSTMRRRVIDRLIEQELLVQRGIELDLAKRDPRIRATLTDAVIGLLVARGETPAVAATDEQLRAFHAEHQDYFRTPARVRLQQLWYGDQSSGGAHEARARASDASRRLAAGEDFDRVSRAGDAAAAPIPAGWLPLGKVRDYVGPAAARAIAELKQGRSSEPLRVAGGYVIVKVTARQAGRVAPFEGVRDQVEAELRRRQGDRSLRQFLDERRRAARITIAEQRL